MTNVARATNTLPGKPGCYNNSFSYVSVASSAASAKTTFIGDRVEFFGERFNGHGNVKVFIDGVQVVTLFQGANPWITDYSRMQPSFYYNFPKKPAYNSPATEHTLELLTDPGNQFMMDMIRVHNYTLTSKKRNSAGVQDAKTSKK